MSTAAILLIVLMICITVIAVALIIERATRRSDERYRLNAEQDRQHKVAMAEIEAWREVETARSHGDQLSLPSAASIPIAVRAALQRRLAS